MVARNLAQDGENVHIKERMGIFSSFKEQLEKQMTFTTYRHVLMVSKLQMVFPYAVESVTYNF